MTPTAVAAGTPVATSSASFNSSPVSVESSPIDSSTEKELNKNLEGNSAINDILESFAKKPVEPVVAAPHPASPDMASLEASVSKIANYLKNTPV